MMREEGLDRDMATPTVLAKEYFNQIKAPKGKQWVEFPNSAHFPMYEESTAFAEILKRAVK
jgi:pimeloyl-ACP methyl ester carboxylesterase